MIINLGCGQAVDPDPQVTNVDRVHHDGVDVVWDLDELPWPFPDGLAGEVRAIQIFEHVADPVAFMAEAHRILADGGLLRIATPSWQSENAFTDPTHRRAATLHTFDYWIPGTALHGQFAHAFGGESVVFRAESIATDGIDIHADLRKLP